MVQNVFVGTYIVANEVGVVKEFTVKISKMTVESSHTNHSKSAVVGLVVVVQPFLFQQDDER